MIEGAANSGAIATDRDDRGRRRRDTLDHRRHRPRGGIAERLRSGREQLAGQAGDKARGLVTQGLERTAEALANVSKMVGDTADGHR